jgi:sialic acid synthase SpsE
MKKEIKFSNKLVGLHHPTYFIADIAANHDGKLEKALDLIQAAHDSGADAAKFQHFDAKTLVSDYGFKNLGNKYSHQKNWKKSIYETYKDASIDLKWTEKLKKKCDDIGIEFFSTPYSFELTDHIDSFINIYKIGSGDITWIELIKYISKKKKPVILSTGSSNMNEVKLAVETVLDSNENLVLMQCNTNYTADDNNNFNYINLNVLKTYKEKFPDIILGLSDHTTGDETVIGAITLGARVIEKHFTLSNEQDGPDHKFSMNPKTWSNMVIKSRSIEKSLGDGVKKIEKNESETKILQRRAIRSKTNIQKGSILKTEHLEFLRPCPEDGISPNEKKNLINRKLKKNIIEGDIIKWQDLE